MEHLLDSEDNAISRVSYDDDGDDRDERGSKISGVHIIERQMYRETERGKTKNPNCPISNN